MSPEQREVASAGGSVPAPVGYGAQKLDRIGLVVHPRRTLDHAMGTLENWAADHAAELVQLEVPGQDRDVAPTGKADECAFVIALGGDGTVLAALHAAAAAGKPVLGVACGSLGALSAVSADRIAPALDRMVQGDWIPRRLPALVIEGDDEPGLHALNDFVFIRGGAGQVSVSITVDDELFVRFGGDGLVVATPLAPHGGSCPPLVAAPDSRLDILIEPGYGGARMEADGRISAELERLEPYAVAMRMIPHHATLVALDDHEPMLAGLRRRRILMDSPRLLARDDRLAAATEP